MAVELLDALSKRGGGGLSQLRRQSRSFVSVEAHDQWNIILLALGKDGVGLLRQDPAIDVGTGRGLIAGFEQLLGRFSPWRLQHVLSTTGRRGKPFADFPRPNQSLPGGKPTAPPTV